MVPVAPAQAGDAADTPLSTDRPGYSTATDIVPRGSWQLETGLTVEHVGEEESDTLGEAMIRIPLADAVEFRLGLPSYLVSRADHRSQRGFDDLLVESKFLLHSSELASYSLLVSTLLPTGARNVAEHRFQPGVTGLIDVALTSALELSLNAGYRHASDEGRYYDDWFGVGGLSFMLTPHLGSFAELYVDVPSFGEAHKYVDGGFTYLLSPNLQLDASAGSGISTHAGGPDYFCSVGLSRRF